jgi:hypothetical protein
MLFYFQRWKYFREDSRFLFFLIFRQAVPVKRNHYCYQFILNFMNEFCIPPLWYDGQRSWLHSQRSQSRFWELPDFLRSSGYGKRSTQPREDNWGATWKKNERLRSIKPRLTAAGNRGADHATTLFTQKLTLKFAGQRRSSVCRVLLRIIKVTKFTLFC